MDIDELNANVFKVFQESQDLASSDTFYEVLKQFLRCSRNTERCQLDLQQSAEDFNASSSQVWQQREVNMTIQGICGDKNKVTHQHSYSIEEFNPARLENCISCSRAANLSAKTTADSAFDSLVAVSRVESELFSIINSLRDEACNTYSSRRTHQIIGVLFKLLRTCSPDDRFSENIIRWLNIFAINSILLPLEGSETSSGRLLLLLHILRVSNIHLSKLIPLVQPPVIEQCPALKPFEGFRPLYFAMLKVILSKHDDRALFLNPSICKNPMLNNGAGATITDKFVFVDEFDNGTGVSLQPADFEEPSLIQLLGQFEIPRVLAAIFSDSNALPPEVRFAFGQQLLDLLFIGLSSYNSPPFRAFFKSMMCNVCDVLVAAQNHQDSEQYQSLFMATFNRFASELKFAFSVLWIGLPYAKLSLERRCMIICRIAGFQALPENNFLQAAKDFAVSLLQLPLLDSAYLFSVCLSILSASYGSDDNAELRNGLAGVIVSSIFYTCLLLPSASDVLWKINRPHFTAFICEYPNIINQLVETLSEHLASCAAVAKPGAIGNAVRSWLEVADFFKSLNYCKFEPTEDCWNVLRQWLINSDITSGEYLLAKDIMNNMPWASRGPGLPSILGQSHHHRAAIYLLQWVSRINLPVNDRKVAWDIMLRLHLVNRNPPQSHFSVVETTPFVKTGEPLACYAAFLMSPTITSSVDAFATQGLPLIKVMLDKRCPNEAIHALLLVLGDHYTRSAFEYLIGCKDFSDLINRILNCSMLDMVKSWAFESALPKDVLAFGIVGHMRSMNAYMVLEFWLCILGQCSEGFQKAPVMDAIELLLSLTPALPDGLPTLNSVLSKHYSDFVESARKHASPVRAFVSWIIGLPFSLVQFSNQTTKWPWFCVASLSHDLQTEMETSFALRFHEQMLANSNLTPEKVFKNAMSAVEDDNKKNQPINKQIGLLPTSAENMAIFRLAQFASQQISVDHPATPLAWLLFFRAFLRKPSWGAKSCGYILLQQQQTASKKPLTMSLVASLKSAADAMGTLAAGSNTAKECQQLYNAMILWLEEPRLHMDNFDARQLPSGFLPEIVATLVDPSSNPWPSETLSLWLHRYVDLQDVANNIGLFADKFRSITMANTKPSTSLAIFETLETTKPPVASYLPLPHSLQNHLRPLFPEITDQMCKDFSSAVQILMASLDAFRMFSTWVSEQQSSLAVSHEKIIEILPHLCTNETVEERISKPCSTFTSYLRPCTEPAVLVARYRKTKRIISQETALNQYSGQALSAVHALLSLLSPTYSQSPVQISVAAIRLEALISRTVETIGAEETGRSLYYTLSTFLDNNPSMWQTGWDTFLSQCLEMLGQTFIRACENQQKAGRGCLLETIINSVKSDYVRRLMISDLMPYPSASPELLEIIANAIASGRIQPDFAFTVLSKFDVKSWFGDLSQQHRSSLLTGALRCLVFSLSKKEFAQHMLVDLLISIVGLCISFDYPEMLHPSLDRLVMFTETYPTCVIPQEVWSKLLVTIFGVTDCNPPLLTVDNALGLQLVDQELRFLADAFTRARACIETSPAWQAAIVPLSLIASRFFCLAVDRAVMVARATSVSSSSFDMFHLLMTIFGPMTCPFPKSAAFIPEMRPNFLAFGECLLHLQNVSSEIRFANTANFHSRLLATYVEVMLEIADITPTYAKELHACFGRIQWGHFVPQNMGEVETLEMLCTKDGVGSFWTGVICAIDWKLVATEQGFCDAESKALLIASLVRMGYNAVLRHPRNSPIGDLVNGSLVEAIKQMDLEQLPASVYQRLCGDVRDVNGRPLPPQVVFSWASDSASNSPQSLKDCLAYLETISGVSSLENKELSEATLGRSCDFLQLIGLLLYDCVSDDVNKRSPSKQSFPAISKVIAALLKRCEIVVSNQHAVAPHFCKIGLEPLNYSVSFGNTILPALVDYFGSSSSDKSLIVFWIASACRTVSAAPIAVNLVEQLLRCYMQFSTSFSWETAQTLIAFTSYTSDNIVTGPTAPSSNIVSYSQNQTVHIAGVSCVPTDSNSQKRTPLDEFILLGGLAANSDALLVVQALARRAIATSISENNFELRKTTFFTLSDVLSRCSQQPKPGDENRLLGLWSLWLVQLVEIEQYLVQQGIVSGTNYNSLALDLAFVARLSNLVSTLIRLGETRSSRGILGAIGLGTKSTLPSWFHLFSRSAACLLARHYPECISRGTKAGSSSSGGLSGKQLLDSLSALRNDRDCANYASLITALLSIVQDASVPFSMSVQRLLGEFRAFSC